MKACFKCNKIKSIDKFYKHKEMADGHLNKCKKCCISESKIDYKKNTLTRNKAKSKWIEDNYVKRKAHIAVGNALRDGRIIKFPCIKCSSKNSQAHHDDYSKPLIVKWLCAKCHASLHIKKRNRLS